MIKINDTVIELNKFPDGTPHIKYDPIVLTEAMEDTVCFKWKYESNEEMIYVYMLLKHIRDFLCKLSSPKRFYLYMYYIPNARMDRVKNQDECFTLKYFCDFINSLNFDKVCVMDAHSNVSLALLNNVVQSDYTKELMEETIKEVAPDILFFPDEGSGKRYSNWFNMPYTFGVKEREWETGNIKGLLVLNKELIKDKRVLIIDDICSRGGTFYHSAKELKKLGAKEIYLHVTHCENSILQGDLINSGLIEKIYTTDSLLTVEHPLIKVSKCI